MSFAKCDNLSMPSFIYHLIRWFNGFLHYNPSLRLQNVDTLKCNRCDKWAENKYPFLTKERKVIWDFEND